MHLLSKEARRKIIDEALARRTMKELSEILGVSIAAISKYKTGVTHPSDETLARLIETANREEAREYVKIMVEDLLTGLSELLTWAIERDLLDASIVSRVERLHARVVASIAGRRRITTL